MERISLLLFPTESPSTHFFPAVLMLSVWLETHLDVPEQSPPSPSCLSPLKNRLELSGLEMHSSSCSWHSAQEPSPPLGAQERGTQKLQGPRNADWSIQVGRQQFGADPLSPLGTSSMLRCFWQLLWFKKLLPPNLQPLLVAPQLC